MNHYVPDFEMDDDYSLPTSSSTLAPRPRKSTMQEDEIMELLWQNGQVVMQSQTQRSSSHKKQPLPSKYEDAVLPATQSTATREILGASSQHHHQQPLFMQEDEMASWLHYPLTDPNFDHDFCADLLYTPSAPANVTSTATNSTTSTNTASLPLRGAVQPYSEARPLPSASVAARPPIPPPRKLEPLHNFSHFSRHHQRTASAPSAMEPGPSSSRSVVREFTVVDSCVTPSTEVAAGRSAGGGGGSSGDHTCGTMSAAAMGASVSGMGAGSSGKDVMMTTTTCEMTVTSSPGGSTASAEPPLPPPHKPIAEDRKRKGREEEAECHSEDAEFESAEPKKQGRGSTSTKRSRAAEVHNLSERRRRDRINEKMRALQELIPRCNKSDKASMLDEAIEYLKSLQLQVQVHIYPYSNLNSSLSVTDDVHGMQYGPNDVSWNAAVHGTNGNGNGDGHGHGNGLESANDAISQCFSRCTLSNTRTGTSSGSEVPDACLSYAPCPCS
ncbi:hypothetical protein Tsubulata_033758 [Turnera subulata]|uniref:BHLH domain-containing protein n=1 Tax=Turnera subulata TaxID=218843 RepID=A0A9Q0JQS9_9ROSI|nr:hypothetical protein Tsubulata_033758 [Turnera subulata]